MSRVNGVSATDDEQPDTDDPSGDGQRGLGAPRLSPALIATLVTIPVMVIVGFIAFAALKSANRPAVPVTTYAAATTASSVCTPFLAGLPDTFTGYGTKSIDGDTATWPSTGEGDPMVVRCGIDRPAGLAPTSSLQTVNGVQWFMTDTLSGRGQAYVCVDHRPYVALWVPSAAGNASITSVSTNIGRQLTSGPLDFG